MSRARTTRSGAEAPLVVYGANAVLELLRSGESVDRVCLGRGPRAAELSAAALARGVRVESADHPAVGRLGAPPRPALVAGGEAGGLRPLVHRTCDFSASMPMAPGVESFNVGVAVAIALYVLAGRWSSSYPRLQRLVP